MISQHLAQRLGIADVEKFYLGGLLHDMGILVNTLLFEKEFQRVLKLAESSETPLCEVEQQVLGFTHCDSGRILADIWLLPSDIAETIEFHHHPPLDSPSAEMTSLHDLSGRPAMRVCAAWVMVTTKPANSIWRLNQHGKRCSTNIPARRTLTSRDSLSNSMNTRSACEHWWILFSSKTEPPIEALQ